MSEQTLIKDILAGDREKFSTLVEAYYDSLLAIGWNYANSREEAKDLVQSSLLKAYENLSKFRNESSFKSWLIQIMINECKQWSRRKGLFRKYQQFSYASSIESDLSSESQYINEELRQEVDQAISRLSPIYKSVLMQRYHMGESTKGTAEKLGISEETVKIRLMRAKRKLKEDLLKSANQPYFFEKARYFQLPFNN